MTIFLGVVVCKGQQVEASLYGFVKIGRCRSPRGSNHRHQRSQRRISHGKERTRQVLRRERARPGSYTVAVAQTGFEKSIQTGIRLDVDQKARVDILLKVGSVTTTVEVAGTAAQVETATATVALTVETKTVTELPLNIRRFGGLGLLMPGTVPDRGGFANSAFGSPFSETTYASNGKRSSGNNVLIDGVDSQNLFSGGDSVQPSPDAIQEFKFQTESFSAAFGKRAGSTLNLITRSGTNDIHGSAFELCGTTFRLPKLL